MENANPCLEEYGAGSLREKSVLNTAPVWMESVEWMESISQGTAVSWHSTKMKVIFPQPICCTEEEKDVAHACLSRLL